MRRVSVTIARGLCLTLLAMSAFGCAPAVRPTPGGSSSGVVNVVAGENFWGDIAGQIGGARVKVTSILSDPNADPHLYESNAANAVAVARAKVVIVNGLGYDDFMSRLLAGSGGHQVVVSAQKVLGVTASDANPHLWYDIRHVPMVAQAIEAALVRADPAGKSVYEAGLAKFVASLQPVLAVLDEIKARYPGAPVAYTERVPGYLLAEAGLSVETPSGWARAIEDGTDPSPADAQAMYSLISGRKVRVLLYNTQAVSAMTTHVRTLAAQARVPVVGVSETLPPTFASYQAWQLDQATRLLKALGG